MTNHERKRLLEAYSEYISGRFNELVSFIILVVGFCLGTLSAQKIPPIFNLAITLVVLCCFWYLMRKEKDSPDSNLNKILDELKKKYNKKEGSEKIMDEINSYDVWKSYSPIVIKHNLPLLFGVLFCIYTLIEHSARVFNCW